MADTEVMRLGSFAFRVNPNSVRWAYRMNISQTDTKGGRVFQLLSCYIDSITVEGEFSGGYDEMRRFEKFFINAVSGQSEFGTTQMLKYSKRGWNFPVYLKSFPEFKYSLGTVVPAYSITLVPKDAAAGKLVTATKVAELAKLADGVSWKKSIYNSPELDPQGTAKLYAEISGEYSAANAGLVSSAMASAGTEVGSTVGALMGAGQSTAAVSSTVKGIVGAVFGKTPAVRGVLKDVGGLKIDSKNGVAIDSGAVKKSVGMVGFW
jgi:hypothetical protein